MVVVVWAVVGGTVCGTEVGGAATGTVVTTGSRCGGGVSTSPLTTTVGGVVWSAGDVVFVGAAETTLGVSVVVVAPARRCVRFGTADRADFRCRTAVGVA